MAHESLPTLVAARMSFQYPFTFGGIITSDTTEGCDEIEVAPESYRAIYEVRQDRRVLVTAIERNDARPGKPAYWVKDRLNTVAHADLERLIQRFEDREQIRVRQMAEEDAA
jgi:hypothetical protein